MRKINFSSLLVFIVFLFSFAHCESLQSRTPDPSPVSAYTAETGLALAQKKISEHEQNQKPLFLLRVGEIGPKPEIDKGTGLEIETLGCVIESGMREYIQAYNNAIKSYWQKNSKKK